MEWFRGRKVFLTGGSSGIGKAAALLLAQYGADVVIAARGKERLLAYENSSHGGLDVALEAMRQVASNSRCETLPLDITDRHAVRAAVPRVLEMLGGLDVLINNAGQVHPGRIDALPDEAFDQMMQVNYFGALHVTRAFLPHFMQQRSGDICNVSSLAGLLGIYGYGAYAASKFALVGLSDCLRQELLAYNVRVSVCFPPDTDTPQHAYEVPLLPEETRVVAGSVKALTAHDVAFAMLKGIERGRFHTIPGFNSRFSMFMYRHMPSTVRWLLDRDVRRCTHRRGQRRPDDS